MASSRTSIRIRPQIVPKAWFQLNLNRAQTPLSWLNSIKRRKVEYGNLRFHCNGIILTGHHWLYSDWRL